MGSSEKFCLRWNDFESNISVAFREIREEKDFFDCTLSCGARQIQAHKLILSACSPFFRSILKQNPHQHPLLYLKGVEFTDLQAVLNFMYHGEVNVAQEELNSFLSVAEDLQIKGLTQNNKDNSNPQKTKPEPTPTPQPRTRPTSNEAQIPKRQRYSAPPVQPSYQDDDIEEVQPVVKQEPAILVEETLTPSQPIATMSHTYHTDIQQENTMAQVDESYGDDGYDYGEYEGYGGEMMEHSAEEGAQNKDASQQLAVVKDPAGVEKFQCLQCGKVFSDRSNCKKHIKVIHFGEKEAQDCCPHCQKLMLKKNISQHVKNSCLQRMNLV